MILYFIITLIVMLLFAGALVIGRLFKKRGYTHTCSNNTDNCSCEKQ
ncbi:MAG: hypothetical protein GY857_15715 [Desulfobacula sp.]|nr:hypothetical protein [Desulfobacula sp.]